VPVERVANSFATTLAAAISSTSSTSISVAAAAPAALRHGQFRIKVDNEILLVLAGQDTTTWTVRRGQEGTTAATHDNGAAVYGRLTAEGLRGAAFGGRMGCVPGLWYTSHPSINTPGNKGAGTTQFMPFIPHRDALLDRVAFYCETAVGTTGQQVVYTLYEDAGGRPGPLVAWLGYYDSGGAAPVAGTVYAVTVSQVVKAGTLYWLGVTPKTAAFTIRSGNGIYNPLVSINSSNPTIGHAMQTTQDGHLFTTGAPGSAPSDVGSFTFDNTDVAYTMMLRFAEVP
jgi:hypothetical protein